MIELKLNHHRRLEIILQALIYSIMWGICEKTRFITNLLSKGNFKSCMINNISV